MRAVAEECFALVREYKGSHSGEHGDGIVRSESTRACSAPRIVRAFEAVKESFDPAGLLNPRPSSIRPAWMTGRCSATARITRMPGSNPRSTGPSTPALLGAVEMCNNNGACRSFDAGVMCPSYRVTRDEAHLTRGRANTLRLALTGQLGADAMASDDVGGGDAALRVLQGVPAGMPDRRGTWRR